MITMRETIAPELVNKDNPKGITYRLFDCPLCSFTIASRLKSIHKCKKCESNIIDVLRMSEQCRYRLAYHKGIVDDEGKWNWDSWKQYY